MVVVATLSIPNVCQDAPESGELRSAGLGIIGLPIVINAN